MNPSQTQDHPVNEPDFVDALDYIVNFLKISDDAQAEIDMITHRKHDFKYDSKPKRAVVRKMKTRAEFGLGDRDWFDARSYIIKSYAELFRFYPSISATKLLNDLIVLNDEGFSYNMLFDNDCSPLDRFTAVDPVNRKSYFDLQKYLSDKVSQHWYENYMTVLNENPVSPVSSSEYVHDLALIRSLSSRPEASWAQWRGVITDPTVSALKELKKSTDIHDYAKLLEKHRRQRVLFSISGIDKQYSKLSYVHWMIVNASIVLASTQAMSYPANKDWDEWSVALLKFAEGIYIAGFSGDRELSQEDVRIRDEAIKNLPVYLWDLWD